MISFARQDLILRPIEKRLYLFADERNEGENKHYFFREQFSTFIFATRIVQSLFFLNPKFQNFLPSSVTVQAGLCQTWSETLKTGGSMMNGSTYQYKPLGSRHDT